MTDLIDPLAAISEQLSSGNLEREETPCLCGSRKAAEVADKDWLGIACSFVICSECGLIRQSPRPTALAYRTLYASDNYRRLHSGNDFFEGSRRRFSEGQGAHILEWVRRYIGSLAGRTVLEVGAGAGWNLVHFAAAGASVIGYDYSDALVPLGREYGLDLRRGSFADALSDGVRADVVVLNHVLEHLTDIPGAIRDTIALLNCDGLVYVGVPDIDQFHYGQFQLAHTYYFSKRTLAHYLARFGLATDEIGPAMGTHIHGVFRPSAQPTEVDLAGEYRFMRRVIWTARMRRFSVGMLDRVGLKQPIRRLLVR